LIKFYPLLDYSNMKNIFYLLIILSSSIHSHAYSQGATNQKSLGIGIVLGSPTAITGKSYTSSQTAFDFSLSYFANDYSLIYGDYLMHYPGFTNVEGLEKATGYIGVGAILAINSTARNSNSGLLGTSQGSVGFGVRVPFGILYSMNTAPVEFFGEIAPGISIVPTTSTLIEAGVGARFFFK
jgi:hypothetical protein